MATLVYCDGDGASARLELIGHVTVGSATSCTIVSGALADQHARIFEADGSLWIEALSERGGVFVETEEVTHRPLSVGEVVVVGDLVMRVDDSNGASRPLVAAAELLRLLEASQVRQRELEDERNALGRRVGELHAELAEERSQPAVVVGAPRELIEFEPVETTTPMAEGFAPQLEQLAEKVRQATKAVAELQGQLDQARDRRAAIAKKTAETEARIAAGGPGEREVGEVELLSLNAQLAELDKTCEQKRARLEARRQELAALRARQRADPERPRRTREYAVAGDDEGDDSAKLAELKERFEAEFSRAVTLQRKLKLAEDRVAELEGELDELEQDRETAVGSEPPGKPQGPEIDRLEARVSDLEKLLEAAKKEAARWRRQATEAQDQAGAAGEQIAELELASSAADARTAELSARVDELAASLAARDGEIARARETISELSEKAEAGVEADAERERLAGVVAELEGLVARAEKARDNAQAERREADVRILDAESSAREMRAKLEVAERRLAEDRSEIERLNRDLEATRADVVEAREEAARLEAATSRENTQVTRLSNQLDEARREADSELDRLRNRIAELERDLDRALDAEQAALARSDAEEAGQNRELERARAELDELGNRLDATREELSGVRRELDGTRERGEKLSAERDRLSAQLGQAATAHAAELAVVRGELEAAGKTLAKVRGKLSAAEERIDELEAERRELLVDRDRAAGLESELESARGSLREARAEIAALGEKLEEARDGENTTEDLRSRVVELASQNAQITAELTVLGEEKSRLEADLETARAELRRLSDELTDTAEKKSALESANTDLTRRYEQVAEQLDRASIDLEALRDDVAKPDRETLERECRQLRERIADLELQLDGELLETTESVARPDTLSDDVELTAVAELSPALIQSMQSLREAVSDLRVQMRTAADEAVMLETGETTEIINGALSGAVERVETAREAIRNIVEILGLE